MVDIDGDAVLVTVVTDTVHCGQARIQILLLKAIWVFIPTIRKPPGFDFFILIADNSLLENWHKSGIDDLTTMGLESMGVEVSLKHIEELLHNTHLAQPLPEEGDCGAIWNAVDHTKPDKLLKGESVVHLEFKFFIAKVQKLLENEHLEKDQQINPLAPCIAHAFVLIALVKQWAE